MEDIILVGFGGHAKSIADSIEKAGKYHIVGYTEQKKCITEAKYEYLGADDVLKEYYFNGVRNAVICVGYLGKGNIRDRLYEKLKSIGYELPVIIDPSAMIAGEVCIEEGTYVGKGSVVNTGTHIEKMCIINTKAIVEHECFVGAFSHVAVGAVLCGNVTVQEHGFIGANATIIQGVRIGHQSVVGAGSTILKDVRDNKTVYGVYKG